MTFSPTLFTLVPAIALLCNLFLFMTLLSAKKDRTIGWFMVLLGSCILWSAGSLFLRMQLYPSPKFWWEVSLIGIILVPALYYVVASCYLGMKGYFMQLIWLVTAGGIIVLNHYNLLLSEPLIQVVDGQMSMEFSVRPLGVVAIIWAIGIFVSIGWMMSRGLRKEGIPPMYFRPLFVGIGLMLICISLSALPEFNGVPMDTLSCALNAVCIYYAFYQKRLLALSQIVSNGAVGFMTVLLTGAVMLASVDWVEDLIHRYLRGYERYETLIISGIFFVLALVLQNLLNFLLQNIFIRERAEREDRLRKFSNTINRTLRLDEIIDTYLDLLHDSVSAEHVYICLHSQEDNCYWSAVGTSPIGKRFALNESNPLVCWLTEYRTGVLYSEFTHTSFYKSMWETEKRLLQELNISYVLPIQSDGQLVGVTLFSAKKDHKPYTYAETNFLESVSAVVSIAIKNANLYETIRREAQLDSLTGLYTRRYFNQELASQFEKMRDQAMSVILFNLDNFHLYNELYGSAEGDIMLQHFARLLQVVFGSKGTITRYGGKEFAVLLPFCDSATAREYALRVQNDLKESLNRISTGSRRYQTVSIGICSYPTAAANSDQLLSYANLAVYSAKKKGKNSIVVYNRSTPAQQEKMDRTEIAQEYSSTIFALTAAIDAKDHYTFNHSRCVAEYAAQLAGAAGLDEEHVEVIRQAGLLHDIGKIGIPDAILTKTGRLTPEEFSIMREHVERSIEMIRHLPSLDYVIPAVLGHHERYDGNGYPRSIQGEDIPIGARCLCIVDSFDAMVSRRSYKDAMPVTTALEEIRRNLGRQFDPELGQLFIDQVESGAIKVQNY